MRPCPACGHPNDEGARFCASCDAYLGWKTGEATEPEAVPQQPIDEPEDLATVSFDQDEVAAPSDTETPSDTLGVPVSTPDTQEDPPAEMIAPSVEDNEPRGMQPVKEVERTRRRQPEPTHVSRGDLTCPHCSAGNDPVSTWCWKCGGALRAEPVPPPERPQPWWRRLGVRIRRWRRDRRRRDRRRTDARRPLPIRRIAGLLGVAGLAGVAVSPLRTNVVDLFREAKERALPNFVPVNPVAAKASSQLKDHPAKAAIDGLRNTYWAEGAKGTGEKQFLTITFAGPSDLARIIITSGASSKPEEFRAQPRPHTLHLVFSDATTTDLTLEDTPDPQDFAIDVTGVTSVEIHIASVYRSIKGTAASIAEIEFRRRT